MLIYSRPFSPGNVMYNQIMNPEEVSWHESHIKIRSRWEIYWRCVFLNVYWCKGALVHLSITVTVVVTSLFTSAPHPFKSCPRNGLHHKFTFYTLTFQFTITSTLISNSSVSTREPQLSFLVRMSIALLICSEWQIKNKNIWTCSIDVLIWISHFLDRTLLLSEILIIIQWQTKIVIIIH